MCAFVVAMLGADSLATQVATSVDCVTIGIPKPSQGYTYERQQPSGAMSRYTQYWEELTATASRVRVVRGTDVSVQTTQHRIEDDVSVIDTTMSSDPGGRVNHRTTFRPGVVGDPAFRACAGRSWTISAVSAQHASAQGNAAAQTYPGTLTIVAIREAVTVPAGRFDTVRYSRILATPAGRSVDEYWKSIEHGVIVRHTSTLSGGVSTEVLHAIR